MPEEDKGNAAPQGDELVTRPTKEVDSPDEFEERIEQITQMAMERYSGPFPHPDHMKRYAKLFPRAPEIIFEQFEMQSTHRREVEKLYVRGNERRSNIGQWLAFSLVVLVVALGFLAVLLGQSTAGSAMIIAAFSGGVILYIAGGNAGVQKPAREVKNNERERVGAGKGQIRKSKKKS